MFAPPAAGGPRRRYVANLGALDELGPRGAQTGALPRRNSAGRAIREAGEGGVGRILRRRKIQKNK